MTDYDLELAPLTGDPLADYEPWRNDALLEEAETFLANRGRCVDRADAQTRTSRYKGGINQILEAIADLKLLEARWRSTPQGSSAKFRKGLAILTAERAELVAAKSILDRANASADGRLRGYNREENERQRAEAERRRAERQRAYEERQAQQQARREDRQLSRQVTEMPTVNAARRAVVAVALDLANAEPEDFTYDGPLAERLREVCTDYVAVKRAVTETMEAGRAG